MNQILETTLEVVAMFAVLIPALWFVTFQGTISEKQFLDCFTYMLFLAGVIFLIVNNMTSASVCFFSFGSVLTTRWMRRKSKKAPGLSDCYMEDEDISRWINPRR